MAGAIIPVMISTPATAQDVDPALYSAMQSRGIGPFRGGRSVADVARIKVG